MNTDYLSNSLQKHNCINKVLRQRHHSMHNDILVNGYYHIVLFYLLDKHVSNSPC